MIRRLLLFVLVVLGLGSTARATKVFADLTKVTQVGNATWNADTKTFAWTTPYSAAATLNGLAGDLSGYTQLVLEASEVTNGFRVDFQYNYDSNWETHVIDINAAGTYIIDFATNTHTPAEKLVNVTGVRLNTNSGEGSAVINRVYLVKPFSLSFNDAGKAYIYPSDLVASGMTIDEETGVITKEGTAVASLSIDLGDVDFSNVTRIDVNVEYESEESNLIWRTFVKNQTADVHVWYDSKYNIDYTGSNGNGSYQSQSEHVKSIVMEASAEKSGSMKLNYICITKDVVKASTIRELGLADFHVWDGVDATAKQTSDSPSFESHIGEVCNGVVYGNGSVYSLHYADLTGFETLKIKATPNTSFRVMMNRKLNEGAYVEVTPTTGADGWATVDLTQYDFVHLNTIKVNWGVITTVYAVGVTSSDGADYYFTGLGDLTEAAQAVLADETTTFIDATGLSNTTAIELQSVNPNCLFMVDDAGKLSNTANVLVKGADNTYTCANLALQAGHAFHTPYAFTANDAQISKTVKASGFSTFVSPFAASVASGCKAYNLTGVAEDKTVVMTEAATMAANAPVMLKNSGDYDFTASNVDVPATPEALTNGVLTAVYTENVTAPKDSYVLQTQTSGTAFYKVENDGVQKVTPFTAYLTIPAEVGVNARMLAIDIEDATAVSVAVAEEADVVAIYDMQGRKVDAPVKGVNLVKLSDGSVKKLIVK